MELCLGTVQFGMDYGVFEQKKKDSEYCIACMDYATQNGIHALDTADAYGIAEDVVGSFLKKKTISRDKLFLSTKLLPNILDNVKPDDYERIILERLKHSLRRLNTDYVDVFFLHSSRYIFQESIMQALSVVKKEGLAKEVGVSIYYENEAKACMKNPLVDYVQAPYSVFDHRMKECGFLDIKNRGDIKLDTRTAFVKGLIRLTEEEVPEHLKQAKPILRKLDEICKQTGYSRIDLAIGYVKRENNIQHLVFGIRDMEQLKEDIISFQKDVPEKILQELESEFSGVDANLVVPSLWKKD